MEYAYKGKICDVGLIEGYSKLKKEMKSCLHINDFAVYIPTEVLMISVEPKECVTSSTGMVIEYGYYKFAAAGRVICFEYDFKIRCLYFVIVI